MRTQQVEDLLGIAKQTILFYEKEGLLKPSRNSNGYREYSEADIQVLRLIKVLRSLDISIDDIKAVLNNELSFQECLQINEKKLEKTVASLQEMKEMVTDLKERNIPLIPSLMDINTNSYPFTIGFHKTNKTVSLGRRLTKKYATKLVVSAISNSAIMAVACIIGMRIWAPVLMTPLTAVLCFILFLFVNLLSGVQIRSFWMDTTHNQYIEFLEKEVQYYAYKNVEKNIKYMWKVLLEKDAEYLTQVPYEDIVEVKIKKKQRIMRMPATMFSMFTDSYEYWFRFKSGETLYLSNPLILDDDGYYLAEILRAKVANINDPQGVLQMYIDKGKEKYLNEISKFEK